MSHDPQYEERLVLFIDFLGFKEAVERTARDEASLGRLVQALEAVGSIGKDLEELSSQRVTQFSDSIVVSYRVDEGSAVFWLLSAIAFCLIELVERGFLLRGAVTTGLLLHTSSHVVGPALVKAYEMESRQAVHPRVIVDPTVLEIARCAKAEQHDADEEETYARSFLSADRDGVLWLDYVRWRAVVEVIGGDNDLYHYYLNKIAALIAAGLAQSHERVLSKYLWLRDYYLEAIEDFAPGRVSPAYERENPEVVETIRQLPRFESEAAKAQEIVDAAARRKRDRC